MPALPATTGGALDGRACRRSSSPTPSRARPTRSAATRSTSSRWCARRCLALPLAPLCDEDCAGPDPDDHPGRGRGRRRRTAPMADDARADPRWAALDALRFDQYAVAGAVAPVGARPLAFPVRARRAYRRPSHPARATPRRSRNDRWPSPRRRPPRRRAAAGGRRPGASSRPPAASAPAAHAAKLPHVVCGNCGWYGGRQAVEVD